MKKVLFLGLLSVSCLYSVNIEYCNSKYETAFYAFKKVIRYNRAKNVFYAKIEARVYQDSIIDLRERDVRA